MSENYHNKGESDASDGNYDPPKPILDAYGLSDERREYDAGYYHTRGQRDAAEGKNDKPHGDFEILADSLFLGDAAAETKELRNDAYEKGQSGEENKQSSCFLTSSCVEFAGLKDDCEELEVMRGFRDNYVSKLPLGDSLIKEYYATAPDIVQRIRGSPDRDSVFCTMFAEIRAIVGLIKAGENSDAVQRYLEMYQAVKAKVQSSAKI